MNLRGRRLAACFALGVALLLAVHLRTASGQSSQATLQGQVIGLSDGRPIGKALVLHRNLQTNTQGYGYTNDQGIFYFPALPPGMYSLRVDALGYQPEERSPIELPVAAHIEVKFALQGGAQLPTAAITPRPAPSPVKPNPNNILSIMYGADAAVPQAMLVRLPVAVTDTLTGALSSLIDENKILELPLAGRDVYTLLVLQPSVTSDNATARGLGFSVNGQQVASSNFLLDGVDNNDLLITGPATFVSADAVKEYRMNTNNFTAEFGRSAGFIANAVTRTGTNQVHGTVFEFLNRDELNANSFSNNWQGIKKSPLSLNQFGGSIGGPIQRQRLFFFGNFEQARTSSDDVPVSVFLPSATLISLAPTGSMAKKLLTSFPPPQGTAISGFPYVNTYSYTPRSTTINSFGLGRIDYNSPDGHQRLSGRYSFSQANEQSLSLFSLTIYPGFGTEKVTRGQNVMVNHTRDLFNGTNELKFGYSRNTVTLLRPRPEIPTLISQDQVILPGSIAQYDYAFRDTVLHFLDNFSKLKGRHALVAGIEWRPGFHNSLYTPLRDGLYGFDSVFSFISDAPITLTITLNRQTGLPATDADFRRSYFLNEGAAFFQDNVKLTRRLTLNLGLRWEYFGAPSPTNGTSDYNFVFGAGSTPDQRVANGKVQRADLFRPDRNNFAPRFGFAYDLFGTGRSVLRGGYGIYFDRIFNNFWMDARSNGLALANLLSFDANGLPSNRFRYTFPASAGVPPGTPVLPSSDIAIDQELRTPYSQTWFLGVQHEVMPNLVFEMNNAGSLGRKLGSSDLINRLNIVGGFPRRANSAEPDIGYRSNQGYSDHVELQTSLNRRWIHGTQFQVSYTYGRTRDVQSDALKRRVVGGRGQLGVADFSFFEITNGFTRQYDPQADYGHSDFDQRHNLVFNFIVQSPIVRGFPNFMSGWQLSSVAGFRSGFPFSVYSPGDTFYLDPSSGVLFSNRADFLGNDANDAFLKNRYAIPGGEHVLSNSMFAAAPSNRMGNSERNAFQGPGFWNVDFSLSRSFAMSRLSEQASLQFRIEMFNLFNHANLNNPENTLQFEGFGDAQYGRQGVSSSQPTTSPLNETPRRIQLGLKLYF